MVVQLQVANRGGTDPREQFLGLLLVRSEVFTRQVRLDEGRHADLSRAARTHHLIIVIGGGVAIAAGHC